MDSKQLYFYDDVLLPLFHVLESCNMYLSGTDGRFAQHTLNHTTINLRSGDYTIKELLNLCCIENPCSSFYVSHKTIYNMGERILVVPMNLIYNNPLTQPRALALKYWQIKMGLTTNAPLPSTAQLADALADKEPEIRRSAVVFTRSAAINYPIDFILTNHVNLQTKIWVFIGFKTFESAGIGAAYLTAQRVTSQTITNDLMRVDPGLALLAYCELLSEGYPKLSIDFAKDHKYTSSEIAYIKPDMIRVCRHSPAVCKQLAELKLGDPDLSPEALKSFSAPQPLFFNPGNANQ